jgi:hypothetical protein
MLNRFKKNSLTIVMLLTFCCLKVAAQTNYKTLNYIYSISGSKTMAGQQGYGYWETMHSVTGKYPAMWGEDLSFVISFGGANMADDRMKMAAAALQRWNQGAVVNIMYHACPPTMSEPCSFDNVKSKLSNPQWDELVANGTQLNNAWKARLDAIAPSLQYLKDNGVEVLFRPFHEMNHPSVFWWANRPGPNGSAKLYQITHDYLVNTKGLTNLIWVWNLQDFNTLASDVNNYDPGSAYYDMFTLDNYNSDGQGYSQTKYNIMVNKAGSKPIGLGECDVLPSTSLLSSQPRWTYFLAWRELTQQKNSNATISSVYNASNVVTLDEMPQWKTCDPVGVPGTLQGESFCSGSGVSTETTTDTGGGRNLSSIETNDWAAYKINVPTTGTYTVQYRVAALNAGGSIRLEKLGGGTVFGTIAVPKTSGWQNWTTISHNVQLTAGVQDIAIVGAVGGFNVNWFSFSNGSCGSAPAQPGTITGNTSVTAGSSQTYSVAAVSGATSYTWTLPSGWSGTSTSTSINTTAGSTGGNISVKANNSCGASTARTLAVTVTASNTNIAYNRPVSVTSIQGAGYEGSKAVDANGTTRWASATANNQNFVVDLGATYNINRIKIAWEAAYARDYQIQVSTNNSTWTTIKEFWGKSSSAADDYIGLNSTARWLKVYCINRATVYGFSIFEFEAYGSYVGARQSITVDEKSKTEEMATIYPNPANDKGTIRIPSEFLNGKIALHNAEGKVLIQDDIKTEEHTFDVGSLSSGFYIIHLSNASQRKSLKLFKR